MDDVLILVNQTYTMDEIGQQVPTETERTIFCEINSVNRSEFFRAGENKLNSSFVATTPFINYDGERVAILNGKKYGIYRTFLRGDDIELYLEEKAGL